ncbi:MAG TPA: glycosyltransferase family 2 protein [Candidatus Onthousia excrementipullorum]|uniref:Glycosyltransferase family 2 protein n=1 Tax=Candidatus Onthousia excrementipullorum TaxID=2840884 RepID=A0A9D1DUK0_9FIRM|nr:glycosyltransferase family 2 protein [Candidatus Onthousia excrementipullorum]
MDKISIIVPCYNEEAAIPLFYREISKIMNKMKQVKFELLFINDGSNDNTLKEIKTLANSKKEIKYISFSRNFGKEAAIYAGLEHSTGDYVTLLDVDLQDPPEFIEEMYRIIKGEDIDCVGLKTDEHKEYGIFRRFFTSCYYKLVSKLSKTEMVPGARDFRLMTRQMADAVLELKEYNRYSKGIFSFVGFETKWITYKVPKRVAGSSKWSLFKLFVYAIDAIVGFSTVPLTISTIVGVLFCFISIVAIIIIIIKTLIFGDPVDGWPSLVCIMFFLSGIQLFCTGISGAYLSKTYTEVKRRPIYIIKETNYK